MANVKITELGALASAASADLVPVVDVTDDTTKKATAGQIVSVISGDVNVADDGTATISELPVSKLQDGAARQLLQTDASGFGVEWTSNIDVPGTLDVTGATTLDSTLTVPNDRVLIGTDTSRQSAFANTEAAVNLQIESEGISGVAITRFTSGTNAPSTHLQRARGTQDEPAIVSSGDNVGSLIFSAYDGDRFINTARIDSVVSGTPSNDTIGGYLAFETNPGAAANDAPQERLRITSAGLVGIGTTSPGYILDCQKTGSQLIRSRTNDTGAGSSIGGFVGEYLGGGGGTNTQINMAAGNNYGYLSTVTNSPLFIGTNSTERLRIDTSGRVLIGTASNSGGALLQVNDNRIRIAIAKTPASATDTGTAGEICWDTSYIYVCTATNTWKRSALSTW